MLLIDSAIAVFKCSKPELSGFPGFKQAILLPSHLSSCIDKAQERNDLIIISLSRSDQAFKIHWAMFFKSANITSFGISVVSLFHPLVMNFSQLIFYRLVPWFEYVTWICPVAPPGMTTGSIFPLWSNPYTLRTSWALKLCYANNLLLPKLKVLKIFSTQSVVVFSFNKPFMVDST